MRRSLSEKDILELYITGKTVSQNKRPWLTLEAFLKPDTETGLGELSLGDRDRLFWTLYLQNASNGADGKLKCGSCDTWIELPLDGGFEFPKLNHETAVIAYKGVDYKLRLPNCSDLLEKGQNFPVENLCSGAPWGEAEFRSMASDALDQADPGLDIKFNISCEECGHQTTAKLDPFTFLWSSITARAHNIIRDIIQLASAFGWSETECLDLGAQKRRLYIDMLS